MFYAILLPLHSSLGTFLCAESQETAFCTALFPLLLSPTLPYQSSHPTVTIKILILYLFMGEKKPNPHRPKHSFRDLLCFVYLYGSPLSAGPTRNIAKTWTVGKKNKNTETSFLVNSDTLSITKHQWINECKLVKSVDWHPYNFCYSSLDLRYWLSCQRGDVSYSGKLLHLHHGILITKSRAVGVLGIVERSRDQGTHPCGPGDQNQGGWRHNHRSHHGSERTLRSAYIVSTCNLERLKGPWTRMVPCQSVAQW